MNTRKLFFDVGALGYDVITDHDLWRQQIARVLDHAPPMESIDGILDLGCGPGVSSFVLAERLPQATVYGIDLSTRMIAHARRHQQRSFHHLDNVTFSVADATKLDWPDETFDLAVGHSFLYLVPDRDAVLREVRRVLRPSGRLVLLEPSASGSLRRAAREGFKGSDFSGISATDKARFAVMVSAWRVVSGRAGRLQPQAVQQWFLEAGFSEAWTTPAAWKMGMHAVGVR